MLKNKKKLVLILKNSFSIFFQNKYFLFFLLLNVFLINLAIFTTYIIVTKTGYYQFFRFFSFYESLLLFALLNVSLKICMVPTLQLTLEMLNGVTTKKTFVEYFDSTNIWRTAKWLLVTFLFFSFFLTITLIGTLDKTEGLHIFLLILPFIIWWFVSFFLPPIVTHSPISLHNSIIISAKLLKTHEMLYVIGIIGLSQLFLQIIIHGCYDYLLQKEVTIINITAYSLLPIVLLGFLYIVKNIFQATVYYYQD